MLELITFYIFAFICIGSALAVVIGRNPVHSVLFLILCFFNAAALFLILGAEFLAMILVIVYVGAVAVLFLFVVMMLNINTASVREGFTKYVPLGLSVGALMLIEILYLAFTWNISADAMNLTTLPMISQDQVVVEETLQSDRTGDFEFTVTEEQQVFEKTNTEKIGQVLYTNYFLLFQLSGLILLVAMIGAITLTLRKRPQTRKQKIHDQVTRPQSDIIEMISIPPVKKKPRES